MTGFRHGRTQPRTRKESQREATRARLLQAARQFFAERGYEATSVTEIAHAAGVTHAMINVYFGGKAGLLYAILTENNQEQIRRSIEAEAVVGGTLARLSRLLEIWVESDLREPGLTAVMLAYSWHWPQATEINHRAQIDAAFAPARRIVARGIAEGEIRPDLDVKTLLAVIHALYQLCLRPAIFDAASPASCVTEMRLQLALVLQGARRQG